MGCALFSIVILGEPCDVLPISFGVVLPSLGNRGLNGATSYNNDDNDDNNNDNNNNNDNVLHVFTLLSMFHTT